MGKKGFVQQRSVMLTSPQRLQESVLAGLCGWNCNAAHCLRAGKCNSQCSQWSSLLTELKLFWSCWGWRSSGLQVLARLERQQPRHAGHLPLDHNLLLPQCPHGLHQSTNRVEDAAMLAQQNAISLARPKQARTKCVRPLSCPRNCLKRANMLQEHLWPAA